MKLFLIASALLISLIALKAQQIPGVKTHEWREDMGMKTPNVDTPKYNHYLTLHIDTLEYFKSVDTMSIINNQVGRAMLYDDAIFWKQAFARAFARINNRMYRDSVLIPKAKK